MQALTLLAATGKYIRCIEERPILLPGLDLYFMAYNELSYDRPVGLTAGPIPWSSITAWCNLHGIHDIDDITTCIRYIRKIEATDFELTAKRAQRE